jgi:hypothetical protein
MEFDVDNFRTIYPQFTMFTDAQLTFMAENALIISGLDQDSRIPAAQKRNLWYMLICHLATLADRGTAGALVSATEGTVSASFGQMLQKGGDADWYNSTPCGAAYWQIIKKFRLGGLWFKGRKCL